MELRTLKYFLTVAREILALAEKAERELARGEEAVSGEIAIGCGETGNMAALSRLIVSFREKYPEVTFDFYTAIANDVKERMENGLGAALVHEFECGHDSLCLRPLAPELSNASVLAWKKNQALSPAVRKFIGHVRQSLAEGKM